MGTMRIMRPKVPDHFTRLVESMRLIERAAVTEALLQSIKRATSDTFTEKVFFPGRILFMLQHPVKDRPRLRENRINVTFLSS